MEGWKVFTKDGDTLVGTATNTVYTKDNDGWTDEAEGPYSFLTTRDEARESIANWRGKGKKNLCIRKIEYKNLVGMKDERVRGGKVFHFEQCDSFRIVENSKG
jgi:hypothetical protein